LVPWLDEAYVERIVFDGKGRLVDVGVQQRLFRGGQRGIQVRDRICAHPLFEHNLAGRDTSTHASGSGNRRSWITRPPRGTRVDPRCETISLRASVG
jgi:hypothetical protein